MSSTCCILLCFFLQPINFGLTHYLARFDQLLRSCKFLFEIDCTHSFPTQTPPEEFQTPNTEPPLDNSVEVKAEEQARK